MDSRFPGRGGGRMNESRLEQAMVSCSWIMNAEAAWCSLLSRHGNRLRVIKDGKVLGIIGLQDFRGFQKEAWRRRRMIGDLLPPLSPARA